jgi:S-adenosylmethionine:tRNA ribosyltransferase-isomerase
MRVADFDYELPSELIAQRPPEHREHARMLILNRDTGEARCGLFTEIVSLLRPEDTLVVNDTRVFPARILGRRATGGGVEALLVRECAPGLWESMLRPGRRLRPGENVAITDSDRSFTVEERTGNGTFVIRFETDDVHALLEQVGRVPLPPYIERQADDHDHERYQTVYARRTGAVAAPTAGLHFTPEILKTITDRGTTVARVTLHVGPGTFQPVKVEDVRDHVMHEEFFELSQETAETVNRTRARGGRVVAVGTTTVRVLETQADGNGRVRPGTGVTDLFMHPPMRPGAVDALLTNFHLPKSTLLMLVSTFASVESVLAAYRLAVRERFRFFSYGDCMFLVPSPRTQSHAQR